MSEPKNRSLIEKELQFLSEVRSGHSLQVELRRNDSQNNEWIKASLKSLLDEYDRLSWFDSLYAILKDLVLNGIKANQKRTFFRLKNLDINNPTDYELGLVMFKNQLTKGDMTMLDALTESYGYKTILTLEHSPETFHFTVENNAVITSREVDKIQHSLKYASQYKDIHDYYKEKRDDSEGEGIGIALVCFVLKSLGYNLNHFSITARSGFTVAEIHLPLT